MKTRPIPSTPASTTSEHMTTLIEAIHHHANRAPAHPALVCGDREITYAQLAREIIARKAALQDAGCRLLAIEGDNAPDWILWDLAAVAANVPTLPLPPFFHPQQRAFVLQIADVSHSAQGVALTPLSGGATAPLPPATAKITFTSGSTGTPKGVCLSQSGLEDVAASIGQVLGPAYAGRHLCVLPLAILLENVAGVYAALMMGATVCIPSLSSIGMADPFRPDFAALAAAINDSRATSVILVPELLRGLLAFTAASKTAYPSLKFIAVGGAKVAPELLQTAHALGLPVYEGYGLSECGSVVSLNTPDAARAGTAGRLLPHIRAITKDGEIVILNPAFTGYMGEPPATGDFATGDLGEIGADGFVTLSGRKKNLIITSFGRNISPEWGESLLLAQPEIAQAVVYGDAAPHLSALVVPRAPDSAVQAAIDRVNSQLPDYAQIRDFTAVPPFTAADGTLTGNGRIRRNNILQKHGKTNMTFFERLNKETAPFRQGLYAVPQLVDGLKGDITRETYIAYLTEAYHHVKHTVRFMMAMGARLPEDRKWLHDAIAEYIEEEKGHEEWILNDVAAAGGDKEAARRAAPNLETQVLVAYNYDYIARKNPIGFLGMVFMLESTSTQIATAGGDAIRKGLGLPKEAFSYLYSHGSLDVKHMKFFEDLVNRVTDPADQAAIIEVAQNTFRLFAGVMRAIPHKEQKRHAA